MGKALVLSAAAGTATAFGVGYWWHGVECGLWLAPFGAMVALLLFCLGAICWLEYRTREELRQWRRE